MNLGDASRYCADAGARLCTAKELEMDVAYLTGCDLDRNRVWSATPCDHGRGFTTLAGAHMYSEEIGGTQCSDPASLQGVRCCCDEEPNTCGLNHMNMDSIVKKCGTLPHDCMFLVTLETYATCGSYCKRHNLECLGGWSPVLNDNDTAVSCTPQKKLGCDTPRSTEGDVGRHAICECDVPLSITGVPSSDMFGAHFGSPAEDHGTAINTSTGSASSIIMLASTSLARVGKGGRAHTKLNVGQTVQEGEINEEQLKKKLDVENGESEDSYYYQHSST